MASTFDMRMQAGQLRTLAEEAERLNAADSCPCRLIRATGWESMPQERWPAELMALQGTLRDASIDEPTFEEFHPAGTRYDSPDAPIALNFFPFNRCDVYRCTRCLLPALRYTEYGGYYVDPRARCVRSSLIVD